MTRDKISSEERQLRRELKWAKEALSIHENGGPHQGIHHAHAEQVPVEFRAKFLEIHDTAKLESHISRLTRDIEDLKGGFV